MPLSPRRSKVLSGDRCIKVLCKHFGFIVVRQRGSHVVLRRETPEGAVGTVVPLHPELRQGTLRNILRLAQVEVDDFNERL
ncbi:MAG: type II toxin-antitoxin system HicA family toxin [Thermoplasmatota archaeon]